ncbi:ATP-binding protein [Ammoniphilus sp. 3BR4]|uniref:ATP-binding protein n=1 Tax=Ammoniphilus sp. 3BR4 TaxID=3158265 RepID=UPI0034662D18
MIHIVGITTPQEVYAASKERPFHLNEILIIEDERLGSPKGEVIQTQSYNRFIPLEMDSGMKLDQAFLSSLEEAGYSIQDDVIHIAKIRLLDTVSTPVTTGSVVRVPDFSEVEKLLIRKYPAEGLALGVIVGTEEIGRRLPAELSGVAPLYDARIGVMEQVGVPFVFDYRAMNEYPHIGIFGGSGSGKSFGMRVLLEEIIKKKVPTIIFDPHFELSFDVPFDGLPKEFAEDFRKRTAQYTLGKDVGIDFTELHAPDVVSLLNSLGSFLSPLQENVVETLHRKNMTFERFRDIVYNLKTAMEEEKSLQASDERGRELSRLLNSVKDKITHIGPVDAVLSRLNMLDLTGLVRGDARQVEADMLARKLVTIRGPIKQLRLFAAYLTRSYYQKRREYKDALQQGRNPLAKFPPFIVVCDEAHNFAPAGGDERSPTKDIIKEIAQEGRKYGVFLVLATQRPATLDSTVKAQLATKFVFKTNNSNDIDTIKEETDLSPEETRRLPYLPSGTAFISSSLTGRSILVRIRVSKTRSPHMLNPFDELESEFQGEQDMLWGKIVKSKLLPCGAGNIDVAEWQTKLGMPLTRDRIVTMLEDFVDEGKLQKERGIFGTEYSLI